MLYPQDGQMFLMFIDGKGNPVSIMIDSFKDGRETEIDQKKLDPNAKKFKIGQIKVIKTETPW